MKTIIDTVHYYMFSLTDLRLHKNRDRLVELVRRKHKEMTGKSCSYESVTRAQRKLWSEGVCLPESEQEFLKWLKGRSQKQTYLQFYKEKRQEV